MLCSDHKWLSEFFPKLTNGTWLSSVAEPLASVWQSMLHLADMTFFFSNKTTLARAHRAAALNSCMAECAISSKETLPWLWKRSKNEGYCDRTPPIWFTTCRL